MQVSARELFTTAHPKDHQDPEAVQAKLYEEVGRLKMELDWLKKLPGSVEAKREWLVPGHPRSAFDANVSCWASDEPIGITNQLKRVRTRWN